MKRKALFIINPIAGGKKKDDVPGLIKQNLDPNSFEYSIIYTDGADHAKVISADAIGKVDMVVAVGGDGTINEVATGIVGSDTVLGVLPYGSGNGLSRFLGVPMDPGKAISNLNNWHVVSIDAGQADGEWFFNMAGMGFDAHIAEVFANAGQRGFFTYVKSAFREVMNYKAAGYNLNIDGKAYEREAFMLSIANSSQYGNNAHVSPEASVQDGLLDVCIIKQFPLWRFLEMGIRMFTKTSTGSKYIEIIKGKHITITRNESGPMHLDGEPRMAGATVEIKVVPASLRMIAGPSYKK